MKIQSPPGMRDFYPQEMRVQNWLFETWRRVSHSFGFEEYEGPIFEYLDLYTLKSGEGIVSELFNFKDRGGRHFAIRPEMTPTLARMVAARANALPRPIKWFSIPRMCRAEKPQRGRLREFYQWNIDILGVEDPLADAEVIAVAVEFFREIGLSEQDVVIRINSRPLASAVLAGVGIAPEENEHAFELIDRHDRLPPEEFTKLWNERYGERVSAERLSALLAETPLPNCLEVAEGSGPAGRAAANEFRTLWQRLDDLQVQRSCEFDLRTVRGLAYYTGSVYEAHVRQGGARALMGGGRYDDLTSLLDGPRVSGTGFGMGDAPVLAFLQELGRLPDLAGVLDIFVIDAGPEYFAPAIALVADLRRAGMSADFSYKRTGVAKQFKQASGRQARYAVVVGGELEERSQLTIKNLATGRQQAVAADRLRVDPRGVLGTV